MTRLKGHHCAWHMSLPLAWQEAEVTMWSPLPLKSRRNQGKNTSLRFQGRLRDLPALWAGAKVSPHGAPHPLMKEQDEQHCRDNTITPSLSQPLGG